MRYLLDDLSSQESSHHDALCPTQREASKSFNGDHVLKAPVTTGEVRQLFQAVEREFHKLRLEIRHGNHILPQPLPDSNVPFSTHLHPPATASQPSLPAPASSHMPSNHPLPSALQYLPPNQHTALRKNLKQNRSVPPITNVIIPNIPRGPDAWRIAVKHWEDPQSIPNGRALKDWPNEWHSGAMSRFTGSKYNQRKDIAEEYIR